ncbi:MAG TPA: AAA family ATPase [Archangium sp.]|uniref:AAA family ATPase n=1 Tax=Archangium sp. TaxID=1872627 RepID=UPI002E325A45|nr:AAA family ATPase [Archangium sp.]HEX5753499.1 AAA family ATPase [Archangium sp.]
MIQSISLQNFKSFGELQTIPLEPITVLVGPNNSGKSNFMSVGRLISNSTVADLPEALRQEGGAEFLLHRPPFQGASCTIGWSTLDGSYSMRFDSTPLGWRIRDEDLKSEDVEKSFFRQSAVANLGDETVRTGLNPQSLMIRQWASSGGLPIGLLNGFLEIWRSLASARMIKLSLSSLRADSEVIPQPVLGPDGRGLAAVLGLWRGAMPEKAVALEQFLARCLPEIRNVFVRPAPTPGHQRLWFNQKDGQQFDSEHVSDGVLAFTALAMHAISAEEGQLFFIEEPEQSIHPKRLRELVDLLKDIVRERKCQFVIATHSTVLLNAFRDEPEAILLFRRSETGTRVKRLSDVPELLELLQQTPPGDLLETGAFSAAF